MRIVKLFLLVFLITVTSQVFAQTVFITKTGEKYHLESCHHLKYSKKAIVLKDAILKGYEACKVCKPSTKKAVTTNNGSSLNSNSSKKIPIKKTTASQCSGKTKSGSRCKRRTKNGNGRCYQH